MRKYLTAATMLAGIALHVSTASAMTPGNGTAPDCSGNVWGVDAGNHITENGQLVVGGGDTSDLVMQGCTVIGKSNGENGSSLSWFTMNSANPTTTDGWEVSDPPANVAAAATPSLAPAEVGPAPMAATAAPDAALVATMPALANTSCATGGVASGNFHVAGGQIIGPDGKPWTARGIDVHDFGLASSAAAIRSAYPGTNMIRVASYMTMGPSDFAGIVGELTSQGIVVEFSDYTNTTGQDWGGGQGEIFTGATLANESAWYASMAKYFASNPYVWFGTDNEPAEGQGLSAWHQATYNAIRGTGNANPILIDPAGWNPDSMQINADQSIYGRMTNIIWDPHIYSNSGNPTGSADAATAWAKGTLAQTQTVQSADGVVPMIVGEYGVGSGPDPIDMVVAVINAATSGLSSGAAAWAWDTSPPNVLSDTGSQYSQMVALYINTDVVPPSQCQLQANAATAINAANAAVAQ